MLTFANVRPLASTPSHSTWVDPEVMSWPRRSLGFLPVQSVYADFYIVDQHWPDFQPEHFD